MKLSHLFQSCRHSYLNLRHIAALRRYYKHLFKLYRCKRPRTQSWYWFISLPQSGTSSLLTEAGFTMLTEDRNRAIIVWQKDQQVAFECHFHSEQQARAHLRALHWLRHLNPVDYLILSCTPNQLSNNQPLDTFTQYALTALRRYRTQAWFIMTQADQIAGFNESYRHIDPEQAKYPHGFTLTPCESNWIQHFRQRFADFMQHLQQTMLSKLHQEYDLDNRRAIVELPQQMAYYQYPLQKLCQSLQIQYNITVTGIYWSSCMVDHYTQDVLHTAIQPYVPLRYNSLSVHHNQKQNQSLFIDHLFASNRPNHQRTQLFRKPRQYLLGTLALMGIAAMLLIFQHSSIWSSFTYNLSPQLLNSSASQTNQPQLDVKTALSEAIQQHEGMALYEDLKVYSMLHHRKWQDTSFLIPKLQQYFPNKQSATIKAWLKQSSSPFKLNAQLINQARQRLQPKATHFAMRLVQAEEASAITLLASKNALTDDKLTIAKRYSRQQFKAIWQQQIPQAASEVQRVLALHNSSQQQLIADIRQQYLQNYRQHWLTILHQLSQAQPQFRQLDQATENLAQLPQLLQSIVTNLRWPDGPKPFQQQIAHHFPDIQKLTDKQIKQLTNALTKWKKQHTSWQGSQHPKQQVFHYIKQQVNNSVQQTSTLQQLWHQTKALPRSLKRPLRRVLRNDWQCLIMVACEFIDQKWQQQITPAFKPLVTRYPLDRSAQKELSLNQLQSFFGNQGQYMSFFDYYLKPFINTHGSYWRWREVLGQSLPFTKHSLEQLMQAYMINRMFFSHSDQDDGINVEFTFIPVAMAPQTQQANFQLGSQQMAVSEQNMQLYTFHWPDDQKPEVTRITFKGKDQQQTQEVKHGIWGLFRLLDEMRVQEQDSSDRFQVLFDLNGQSIKLRLLAEDQVNPFNLSLLHGFSLPSSLIN